MKRNFGAKAKKKKNLNPSPQTCEGSAALALQRAWHHEDPPPPQMSKMYLMRSSSLTNEGVICQKGKSAVNLVRAHPLTPCQHALQLAGSWAGGGAGVPSTAVGGN